MRNPGWLENTGVVIGILKSSCVEGLVSNAYTWGFGQVIRSQGIRSLELINMLITRHFLITEILFLLHSGLRNFYLPPQIPLWYPLSSQSQKQIIICLTEMTPDWSLRSHELKWIFPHLSSLSLVFCTVMENLLNIVSLVWKEMFL